MQNNESSEKASVTGTAGLATFLGYYIINYNNNNGSSSNIRMRTSEHCGQSLITP